MTTHESCPHCHAPAPESPSRLLRALVVGVAWTVSMFFVFAGILLGPGIIGVLPILIPMGIASITAAHTWAWGDRVCEACGKLVELDGVPLTAADTEPEAAPASTRPRAAAA